MRLLPVWAGDRESCDSGTLRARCRRLAGPRDVDFFGASGSSLSQADDYITCKLIWHVLNVRALPSLSRVCRRWSQLARQAECWADKEVYIADLSISPPELRSWCACWRRAKVAMTFSQKDSLAGAPLQAHLIQHPWCMGDSRSPWARIVAESSGEWLACVTQYRGPDVARIAQVHEINGLSQHFETPVCIGWTSAANPCGLAIMSDRYSARSTRPGDLILGLSLLPFGHHPRGGVLQDVRELSGEESNVSPPLHFDEVASVLATARLDRPRRAIDFETEWGEGDRVFACAPIADDMNLKFFIATPMDRARDLPRTRLPRPWLDWTVFDPSPRLRTGPLGGSFELGRSGPPRH